MKRTREHVLEKESRLALENLLPSEWIFRERTPDYGIDAEIEIVEKEEVTNKVLWIQLKATESRKSKNKVSYDMRTHHLEYYEKCRTPVLIVYWIKSENTFYYMFAQRYIREELSKSKPDWRNQNTVAIPFDSVLDTSEDLDSIATDGLLYLFPQQLPIGAEKSAVYWLAGIPRSDDEELKERTLRALQYSVSEMHAAAVDELEKTLRVCVLSPTEKMSVLLNLGNAYYSLSQNAPALKNYEAVLELAQKADEKSALEGKSAVLGNIGLIYRAKGDVDEALKYLKIALRIHREIGYKQGEASDLGNIGLVYNAKGDVDEALKYLKDALRIHREIGYKQGEASALGNIGLIYSDKGDVSEALKYHKDALKIHREIGYKQGEASQLGNIGLVYSDKGDVDEALKYHKDALKIDREIGYKQGEASDLGNIGLVYNAKGDVDEALKYLKDALRIHREIGYKQGEANQLGNIGLIYRAKGDVDEALKYLKEALKIDREIGYKQGEASHLGNIGLIHSDKGDVNEALKYLKDALTILDTHGLTYGRDIICRAIDLLSDQ